MMEASGRGLFRLVNARARKFPIALDGEHDGALASGDAGKRCLVDQVNRSFLGVFNDRSELAAGLQ